MLYDNIYLSCSRPEKSSSESDLRPTACSHCGESEQQLTKTTVMLYDICDMREVNCK